jgi:alkylation response protein AidB-like acyl-CoA dehydrogenase
MDFGLSEEQRMLQDTVSRYLTEQCPLERVREAVVDEGQVAASIRLELARLGLGGLLVPAECGGLQLGMLEAVLVQEQFGANVSPAAYFAASLLAVVAITHGASDSQKHDWLPAIVSAEMHCALAINEACGARDGAGVHYLNGCLNGKALFVLELTGASHILVSDQNQQLHLVAAFASGITARAITTIDKTRTTHEVGFSNVCGHVLDGQSADGVALAAVLHAARLLLAADTLGAAQKMLVHAVDYAKQREQFGRVVASFQAVKHMCADMAAQLEPCRSLIWYAAHATDSGAKDAALMALLAKSHLADVGQFVARTATEVHGGIGFTDLLGLHYWFKRIGANRQLFGGPQRVRDAAAKLQGWTV